MKPYRLLLLFAATTAVCATTVRAERSDIYRNTKIEKAESPETSTGDRASLGDPALIPEGPIQDGISDGSAGKAMTEDKDGDLQKGEYTVVDTPGSIFRALCPFTCEMRGVPQESCKTWGSKQDPTLCYVQDLRIATDPKVITDNESGYAR